MSQKDILEIKILNKSQQHGSKSQNLGIRHSQSSQVSSSSSKFDTDIDSTSNSSSALSKQQKSPSELSQNLQKIMLRLKSEFITEDGKGVDYSAFSKSSLFTLYLQEVERLNFINLSNCDELERMAFFINIYNSLTIHGLCVLNDLPKSILDLHQFWKTTAYSIGSLIYTLDDIEHGILRANRPHPSSSEPPFEKDDPRLKFSLKQVDPRIHFALVCGAKSCPAINVYTTKNLELALNSAASSFCNQEVVLRELERVICISKLFQWYRLDFGENDVAAIRWTKNFLKEEKKIILDDLLHKLENEGMVDIVYSDYNWQLNSISKNEN